MANPAPSFSRDHIHPGDRLCAAVSGGSDSVALLLLLHEANSLPRNSLGVGLSAVHVHHGLRGEEADADLAFVQELCLQLEVPLHIHRASVPDRLAATRAGDGKTETVEEAARVLRYGVFADLLAAGHADAILTAHTLDDQAETVLIKLLRGAWTEGLAAIHPVVQADTLTASTAGHHPVQRGATAKLATGRMIRPLLGTRRAELEAYLQTRDQPWRTDSSNANDAFTRNRIRHQLLPNLREFNPSIDQALANLAQLAREDEARWQSELSRILPQVLLPGKPVRGGGRAVATSAGQPGSVALELDRLRGFDPALRRRVIRAAARTLGCRLNFEETAALLALAGASAESAPRPKPGARLQLANGLQAECSARELRLSRDGKA
jgi:tRNA(Ile)-lysidine synthase